MKAPFQPNDPVPQLLDELVDGLQLLYECRRRGVPDLDRLLEYLKCKIDAIEHERLGVGSELFHTTLADDEREALSAGGESLRVVPSPQRRRA